MGKGLNDKSVATQRNLAGDADSNIKNAFKRYPPSPTEIEKKKQQWAKEDAAKKSPQPK